MSKEWIYVLIVGAISFVGFVVCFMLAMKEEMDSVYYRIEHMGDDDDAKF